MSTSDLLSEMPGSVVSIEKTVGDAVEADETVLVIEAMKMEIPVGAPRAGKISTILVGPGDQISEGQKLAIIEF